MLSRQSTAARNLRRRTSKMIVRATARTRSPAARIHPHGVELEEDTGAAMAVLEDVVVVGDVVVGAKVVVVVAVDAEVVVEVGGSAVVVVVVVARVVVVLGGIVVDVVLTVDSFGRSNVVVVSPIWLELVVVVVGLVTLVEGRLGGPPPDPHPDATSPATRSPNVSASQRKA